MLRRLCVLLALALAGSGCAYRVDIARPAALAETTKVFAADGSLITTLHAEQAASQVYFHKPASDVSLAEGALLAGLIQAPEGYDPYVNPDAALARRQVVLGRMRQLGSAPESDITAAVAAPLGVGAKKPS